MGAGIRGEVGAAAGMGAGIRGEVGAGAGARTTRHGQTHWETDAGRILKTRSGVMMLPMLPMLPMMTEWMHRPCAAFAHTMGVGIRGEVVTAAGMGVGIRGEVGTAAGMGVGIRGEVGVMNTGLLLPVLPLLDLGEADVDCWLQLRARICPSQ